MSKVSSVPTALNAFGEWLQDHGISFAAAARELGVTRAYVCGVTKTDKVPSMRLRYDIEDWTRGLDPERVILAASWGPIPRPVGRPRSSEPVLA